MPNQRCVTLDDLASTRRLAATIARATAVGDVIALDGPLGAGKTVFARAFIAALGGTEEVPSPTFTLVQTYPLERLTVWHFDLYRLESWREAYELGIEEAFDDGVSVIEWSERLGPLLPTDRLSISLEIESETRRRAILSGWPNRLDQLALNDV